jgi:von Willebrand factor type A domain-containing protein
MASLAQCEETLALFTEGIAGRYYHIKSTEEFVNHRRLAYHADQSGQSSDAIYLPEHVNAPDNNCYRVLVLEQLGLRECGTFSFRIPRALAQIPALQARYVEPKGTSARTGDFYLLFGNFAQPGLAMDLFTLLEKARVQAHVMRTYPGITRHLNHYHQHLLFTQGMEADPLTCGHRYLWGEPFMPVEWQGLRAALDQLTDPSSDVYTSVTHLCALYDSIEAAYVFTESDPYLQQEESLPDWLSREQRIEEWEENLEQLDERVMAVDMLEAEDVEAKRGESDEASVREADVDIKSLVDERDTLKRRIDMERSSVQHALGADRSAARSFRYDEWDYLQRRYLSHWCRVYEEVLDGEEDDTSALTAAIRNFKPVVQRQLEQIRPTGLQRVSRVQDGDELDLNAIIEARQDIRAGHSPSERFYSRKERMHRDVCALFLVDLSASTDDPIEPPEPFDWEGYDENSSDNMRDPWFAADADASVEDEPKRKIIDIQREAMVVMASALDALGDSYGIYGFSGYGKDNVEVYVAKEPNEGFSQRTLQSIAAMKPKRSTRMGPAIRHSTHKLMQSGHAMKVLIIISDGFPQDSDYGPERGNHDYGVEDTARALTEAHQKGVETFCVTVDRSGQDYLKRMCPDERYLVIEEIADLPDQLSKVYTTLTAR